jgi:CzcA family heavy metal efflux pump
LLNGIIRFALNHRILVIVLAALIVAYGGFTARNLPIDVFPDITKPTVTILTEAHGMAPEEVETRVTLPIEAFLNGLTDVDRVRSQSGIGLSVIYVEFKWGSDIYRNRQLVQERLTLAKERIPRDVTPTMGPVGSLLGQIQQIAVYSSNNDVNEMQVRSIAEWTLRPRLMTIPGVAQVIIIGGGLKQYQILVSAEKLNRNQLSIDQLDKELAQISQNTTGGFLNKDGQEYLIRNIGVVETIDDIKRTLIGLHFGRPVLIGDIADVIEAPRLKRGEGSFNGKPSVIMTIQKQPGSDTVAITRAIETAIKDLKPSLPQGLIVNPDVFKQSNFIESSISGILNKLKLGTILVFGVLLVFLANLRMSLITLMAVPISFMVTAIVFHVFGLTVNTMTLGGLAIAIGELVDDSIVDAENVFRRLRENASRAASAPLLKVIFDASSEVRNSITLATVIIALVFVPLFNLDGLEGRLFAPLGVAYLTALLASLIVSLTLTPVLCWFLLRGDSSHQGDTPLVIWLKKLHKKILEWSLPKSDQIIAVSFVIFAGSISLIPLMGRDFLPKFNEGTAMIAVIAPPGIGLPESNDIGAKAEDILLTIPEVKSVSRRTGRAEMDEHAAGVHVSEIDVDFHNHGRPREAVLNEIRGKLKARFPNVGVNVGQPISHLIDHMLSGVNAAIAIKVFGPDLTTLREKAIEVENSIGKVKGLVDLRIEEQGLIPQVKIHVLRDDAAKYGLSAGEITKMLEAAFNGEVVAQVLEDTKIYDVFFQFDRDSRADLDKMRKTVIKIMPNGQRVTLDMVSDIYETYGPNEINREGGQRRIVISANVSGRDLKSLVEEIQTNIRKKVTLPEGYYVVYGGQFESQQNATRKILIFGFLSIATIAILLFNHFRSKRIAAQILATIPLAFIGGIVFLFISDRSITVASLVGFITLCGISSRNGIMMISHYLHLMKYEGESFTKEMIIRGSQERLIPVLMTASVATLALLPLALASGQPGSEVLHPVAVVIVGGLLSSTLLDILVTPALFYRYGRSSAEKYVEFDEKQNQV